MKNFDMSKFLGCCVIGICIVAAGWLISKELPETAKYPASLAITTSDTGYGQFGDYLSIHEVAGYLRVTTEDVEVLMEKGQLNGVYTKINANYVFSKEALKEWVENRVGN